MTFCFGIVTRRCLQDGSVLRSTVLIDKFGRILKVRSIFKRIVLTFRSFATHEQ